MNNICKYALPSLSVCAHLFSAYFSMAQWDYCWFWAGPLWAGCVLSFLFFVVVNRLFSVPEYFSLLCLEMPRIDHYYFSVGLSSDNVLLDQLMFHLRLNSTNDNNNNNNSSSNRNNGNKNTWKKRPPTRQGVIPVIQLLRYSRLNVGYVALYREGIGPSGHCYW